MIKYIVRRLCEIVPVLLIVATLTFFLIHAIPGGPFSSGNHRTVPKEIVARINHQYGLDQPVAVQYLHYMGHVLRGDLGPSYKYPVRTVNGLIAQAFPVSAELGLWGLALAMLLGIPVGILSSLRPNTASDYVPMALALLGMSIPSFVLGPLLIMGFAIGLGWFDSAGWYDWSDRVLPVLTLGIGGAAGLARMTRSGMIEIFSQDYIRTARAKGASEWAVVFRHALPIGLTPVLAMMGPVLAEILTGSFAVEMIFQIPGLGRFFVNAAFNRDYTMVMGATLFYAVLLLVFNLVFDLVMVALNPRLRNE